MERYTDFLAALTALLAALTPIYVMAWKTARTSKKAADQATLANDAVNNSHPDNPRLGDNVMELVQGFRAQKNVLEKHSAEIKQNGKDLKALQSYWAQTVQRLDSISETCAGMKKCSDE